MIITDSSRNSPLDSSEWNPDTNRLLKAVEELSLETVKSKISNGVNVNGYGGAFHETPLHKAAQLGWTEGVELLLENGANIYAKNHYDQTPLHYACASKSCECVRVLLEGGCHASLQQQDKRGHTPLHDAAANGCVKCVNQLLKGGAQVTICEINGETPLHKAAKSRSIPTMLALLNKGADLGAKDKTGESVLSYILRHSPGGLDVLFDNCLVTNTDKISLRKLEVSFNFCPISDDSEESQVRILRDIVDLGHPKLLLHPLCESYLLLKWHNLRLFFFVEVIFYFIYAILASHVLLDKFVFSKYANTPHALPKIAQEVMKVIVLIQAVIIFLKEGLVIFQGIRTWNYSLWHVLNGLISILMIVVFLPPNTIWQHHLATITILLLWVQCMLHISRFPSCGIYVAMFTKVAKVFLRIFLIFFCLLFAFSMSFFVNKYGDQYTNATRNLDKKDPRAFVAVDPVYADPGLTFFKTLTMMIGELDFDEKFVKDLEYVPGTSHVIYLCFVILVSIILSNLLVALAVNDVQGLRNSAYLERLIKQMELIFQIERTFVTLDSIASSVRLSGCVRRRKAFMHDFVNSKVSIEPNHPQKSRKIVINDKGNKHDVDIKKVLVTSILDCLRAREDVSGTNKKLSIKRRITRSTNDEYQDGLKNLETTLIDALTEKLDEMNHTFQNINRRIDILENMIKQRPIPATSYPSRGVRGTQSFDLSTSTTQLINETELPV